MSVVINSLTLNRLIAQPFGYEGSDIQAGLTARRWNIAGLATPSEWLSLLSIYDAWRNLKIEELPAIETGVVGATVALSGTGPGGQTWSNVNCWFSSPPNGTQSGAYVLVDCVLVDANQALSILLKQRELEEQEDELDLGTFTINGVVLKLLKPVDSYDSGPSLELTANGSHYVSGPLSVTNIKDIEGDTDAAGWATIRAWYESIVQTTPEAGTYYPTQPPSATASSKIIDGAMVTAYTVAVRLALVK